MDNQLHLSKVTLHTSNLSDCAFSAISDFILNGDLSPGQRLRESQLADALGISRTPVRDALSRLERQNFISKDASGGYYVAIWDKKMLLEVATLRCALESLAFVLAQERIKPQDFDVLEDFCDQMDVANSSRNNAKLTKLDLQFHQYVHSLTGHTLLQNALQEIAIQVHYSLLITRPGDEMEIPQMHRELIEALKSSDPKVAERMIHNHIIVAAQKTIMPLDDGSIRRRIDALNIKKA